MRDESALTGEFEAKYDAYGAMVYRLAMVYLGCHADAEDVTQEAFLRLLYKAPEFADAEHEKRWLLRVRQKPRSWSRQRFTVTRTVSLESSYPIKDENMFGIADELVRLPEKYKAPIHLHYYEGYSIAEIAEILGLSHSAVKMRMTRGRDMLKLRM